MKKISKNNRLLKLVSLWLVAALITVEIPAGAYAAEVTPSSDAVEEGLLVDDTLAGGNGEELISEEPLSESLSPIVPGLYSPS